MTHESPYSRILDRHQARVRPVFEDLMKWVMSTQFFLISDLTCLVGHIATTLGCPARPSRVILDTRVDQASLLGLVLTSFAFCSKPRLTSHHVHHHPRGDLVAYLLPASLLHRLGFRDRHLRMELRRERVDPPSPGVGQILLGFSGPRPPFPNRASSTPVSCVGTTLDGDQRPGPREVRQVPL